MVTEVTFDRWNYVTFITDDWCIPRFQIKGTNQIRKFNYKTKKSYTVNVDTTYDYYAWEVEKGYVFNYTQFPIILNELVKLKVISVEEYSKWIKSEFDLTGVITSYNGYSLPKALGKITLYDEQLDLLTNLMSKRFGICHVYTGFGKTEMIAYMCYYYVHVIGWNVLVTAPNARVLNEIVLRLNDRLDTQVGVNYPNDSGVICINAGSVAKQKFNHNSPEFKSYLESVNVILADEVEADLTPTHLEIYKLCSKSLKCKYGFSATPDVVCGNLDIHQGITEASYRSKRLLDNFGGSIININPSRFNIDIYKIKLANWKMKNPKLLEMKKKWIDSKFDWSIYSKVSDEYRRKLDNDLFLRPEFAQYLSNLADRFPNLVITINRTQIIDYWVSQLPDVPIVEVSGRGYRVRYDGKVRNISLDELKSSYKYFKLILGSRSLMRGVDLPELTNSVQLSGETSGTTIQSIGRTARTKSMNIIILETGNYTPGYSSQNKHRLNLIETQYSPELNNITQHEEVDNLP